MLFGGLYIALLLAEFHGFRFDYIGHKIFEKIRLPLAAGRWASSEKDSNGEIEIVISGGTDAVLDKVYNTRLGKIKVVGVLADNTYIPPGNFPNLETEDKLSIFDFYKPFDCNINTVAPFALVDQNLFTGEPADYNSTWFISYEDGLSDEDIAYNTIVNVPMSSNPRGRIFYFTNSSITHSCFLSGLSLS